MVNSTHVSLHQQVPCVNVKHERYWNTLMSKPISRFTLYISHDSAPLTVWCVGLQSIGSAFISVGTCVSVHEWHIRVSHSAPSYRLWKAGGEKHGTFLLFILLLLLSCQISFFWWRSLESLAVALREPTSTDTTSHFNPTAALPTHLVLLFCAK